MTIWLMAASGDGPCTIITPTNTPLKSPTMTLRVVRDSTRVTTRGRRELASGSSIGAVNTENPTISSQWENVGLIFDKLPTVR